MYGEPSGETPWSSICTTCGLFTCDAAAASREKRAVASGLLASSLAMNFTTTWVRRDRWSATQTLPIPPSPSGRTRRTLVVTSMPSVGSDAAGFSLDATACSEHARRRIRPQGLAHGAPALPAALECCRVREREAGVGYGMLGLRLGAVALVAAAIGGAFVACGSLAENAGFANGGDAGPQPEGSLPDVTTPS